MANPSAPLPPAVSDEPQVTPAPEVSAEPAPEVSAEPAPEASAEPAPEGSAEPAPEGSAAPAPTPEVSAAPQLSSEPEESLPILESAPPQTTEMVESPSPEVPAQPMELTGLWMGLAVLFALAAAVLAVLLFRSRKSAKKAAAASGTLAVGKLHELGGRKSQQDCFAVSPEELAATHGLLAVVADGMGGLADGDKVSQAAVTAMLDGFWNAPGQPGDVLLALTESANRAVNRLLGPGGMGKSGSTLVAGLIRDGQFHYISVGDSRICLFRDGQLIQLNREHIFRHELSIRAVNGEGTLQAAAAHPKAAGLTSYLGMGQLKHIDIPTQPVTIRPGDKFILMSDGVYNALSQAEMTSALGGTAAQSAEELRRMIQAKAYANQDNYTAVILSC